MAGDLGNLVVSLSADIARFQSDMGKSVSIVDKASKDMAMALGMVPKAIGLIGTAVAALGGGKLFGNIIEETTKWNSEVVQLSKTLGITTEEASIFELAIDDIGLSHDAAVSAALKLSRTLAQGTDKFDQYGVKVKDANGNLLSMPAIIANVNQSLLETKAGTDRNIMALSLYGRSWGEIQSILKLTPERMADAQRTAERLHLLVGPEGAEKTRIYKEALNEADDVVKSLKIQIGNELIPELTRLAVKFSEAGQDGMPKFISGMHSVEAEVIRLGMLIDKLGGTMTVIAGGLFVPGALLGNDNSKKQLERLAQWNIDLENRYKEGDKALQKLANLEVGLDENGNPIKKKNQDTGGSRADPGVKDAGEKSSDIESAYLAYLKSYYETIAQIQKQHNEAEEQANQIAYNWGLKSLEDYLNKKHQLTESSLQAELDAKKKELAEAEAAEKKTLAAYGNQNDATGSAEVSKAYQKTQEAIRAVSAAEASLQKQRVANADETKKSLYDQGKGLNDLGVQILELSGQYEAATKARIAFYKASPDYLKLSTAERSERDKIDSASLIDARLKDKQARYTNQSLAASVPDIYGNTNRYLASSNQHQQELEAVQAEIDKMEALYEKDTENYRRAQEKKKIITDKFNAENAALQASYARTIVESQLGLANDFATLINTIWKDNKTAAVAALAIQKGVAIAETIINTQAAAMRAYADLGPVAGTAMAAQIEALGAIKVGIIAATGVAEAANTISGKAEGGAVNYGQTYLVGEKGPELFTPGASGVITPNNKLGGNSVNIVNNYDFTNAAPETEQRMKAEIKRTAEKTKADILMDMNRGGMFARASGRIR